MQGLVVVGLMVEEISNIDVKVESVHVGEVLCKVWWL